MLFLWICYKHNPDYSCSVYYLIAKIKSDAGRSGDRVYAFGSGKRGQLGISEDKINKVNLPEVTCGLEGTKIASIAANGDHSAALSGGSLKFSVLIWQ